MYLKKEYSDHQAICGIDEGVGRGRFAGRLLPGCHITKDHPILYLNDSKKYQKEAGRVV